MFILDGKPLSPDVAFSATNADGELLRFPANWLRLASPEEREAIGITEVPDPTPYDQRFYWGPGLPKDHDQLVEQWIAQTRTTAGTLLTPTDWMVVREIDNGTAVDPAWKAWREAIRVAAAEKVIHILTTNDTAELAEYITGTDYPVWPSDPSNPAAPALSVAADGLELDFNGGVTGGVIL